MHARSQPSLVSGPGASRPAAHVSAVLFASTCVLVGVLWDISWHQSIGRDTFFSPPHLAIYAGGVTAGLACGWLVLRLTFAGSAAERAATVSFWRVFRGPLGAWVAIWGALAMITSAPFDDWWHNAYGLDTKILSPPHALLAAGIGAINLGALLLVLPLQNGAPASTERRRHARLVALAAGLLLLMVAIIVSEYHYRVYMHGPRFYFVAGLAFPVILAAAGRAADLPWPATATAAVYSAVTLALMWILPLFPAEPKLAPIYIQVTNMVPPSFPLLLVVPAVVMDLLLRRSGSAAGTALPRPGAPIDRAAAGSPERAAESHQAVDDAAPATSRAARFADARLAALLGTAFLLALLAAQWPFADFLMSDWAQNPVFAADNFPYQVQKTTYYYRREFVPLAGGAATLARGLAYALVASVISAWTGLKLGAWLRSVRR